MNEPNNDSKSFPDVFYDINGKEECDDDLALSILLKEGVVFCNERNYTLYSKEKFISENKPFDGSTVVIFVNCNDLFAWAVSDGEDLPISEVGNLYKMFEKDAKWGSSKWCCIRRNQKPQKPVADMMKEDGSWDDTMENLPKNRYDEWCEKQIKKTQNQVDK